MISSPTVKKEVEDPQNEPEELRRFREEWKLEVKRRKAVANQENSTNPGPSDDATSSISSGSESKTIDSFSINSFFQTSGEHSSASSAISAPSNGVPPSPAPFHVTTAPSLSQGSSSAVATYRQAVIHEQRGELDEALYLYRSAFRRDPRVHEHYDREETLGAIMAQQIASISSPNKAETFDTPPQPKVVLAGDGFTLDDLSKQMEKTLAVQEIKDAAQAPRIRTDTHGVVASRSLEVLLLNFPQELVFEPEDEEEPIPLNILPDEMIVNILKYLDSNSLERFGSVNRKARVVSLDTSIWRKLVNETYKPPQIPLLPDGESSLEYLSQQYLNDYRRLYIEHPRIRMDGVYIAVCHYIRPGLSENSWVNVTHLITYHRYLRFFPNGQVISLLTNEEQSPAQVIPLLKPTLRGLKGLFFGNWHLSGNTVYLSNLIDASSHALSSVDFSSSAAVAALIRGPDATTNVHGHHTHARHSSDALPTIRYVFKMSLALLSRPLGRWNKMDIVTYDSVSLESGETNSVGLKHERPFWFSKVRSYVV